MRRSSDSYTGNLQVAHRPDHAICSIPGRGPGREHRRHDRDRELQQRDAARSRSAVIRRSQAIRKCCGRSPTTTRRPRPTRQRARSRSSPIDGTGNSNVATVDDRLRRGQPGAGRANDSYSVPEDTTLERSVGGRALQRQRRQQRRAHRRFSSPDPPTARSRSTRTGRSPIRRQPISAAATASPTGLSTASRNPPPRR